MYQGLPRDMHAYNVYSYEHIDCGKFLEPRKIINELNEYDNFEKTVDADLFIQNIAELFTRAGWEGDGNIGLIWIPPFLGGGCGGTSGFYLWHVKQSKDGTSWIASPVVLPDEDDRLAKETLY